MQREDEKITYYSTAGGSMFPAICWNEKIVVKKVPPEKIEIGDVILFISDHNLKIAHRVVKKEWVDGALRFQTKGDHNYDCDEPIFANKIIGKVLVLKRRKNLFVLPPGGIDSMTYLMSCKLFLLINWVKKTAKKIIFMN